MLTSVLITQACSLLADGQVVAIPTETVYGLAADATNDQAITKIYQVKDRPSFNPLIIHVADLQMAQQWAVFNDKALMLAEKFWIMGSSHRPLTLVLPKLKESGLSELATAGLDTVGVRVPNHPLALEVIKNYGKPLAAPSANRSNTISPTSAQAVFESLSERVPLILDGGSCSVGVESTILDLTNEKPILLRPGGTTLEELESVLQCPIKRYSPGNIIKAPGMLKRHYAPSIPLRLNATEKREGEALLGFGTTLTLEATLNLSNTGDLAEAAANLFRMMKMLDNACYTGIAVAPIPNKGLGLAINDRLARASS